MDIQQIITYFGAFLIGAILGLIGGGGSILTVPLLVYFLSFNPVIATAYSLFVVGSSSLVGVIQKHKKGLVDFKTGLIFSFPSFIAVYFSRRFLVPAIPETLFTFGDFSFTKGMAIMIFFAVIMFLSAFSMIKSKKNATEERKPQAYFKTFLQGIFIGIVTGLIGAGGGFLYVPALVLWAGLDMKKAVGTSLIIIAINSLIGFAGDVQVLSIDWKFLLTFSFVTILGILVGGYFSKFISSRKLKKSFGWFVLAMSVYIIFKELTK
ncbi:hypothetical protein CLV86_0448 [Lacinutrix venerupis]|uniref:sulfite exporter TauE/SafE family protein n=1 Tax=Lacinutrix venerupis TaxID=1486034 RepID=UPI000EB2D252|nr:sulfite exporter TauE/SafE family protein [Lacinutrix venerupis]RLJ69055.1 hypothetical protein CLV86_0448 [Lacinutrix venerupis]